MNRRQLGLVVLIFIGMVIIGLLGGLSYQATQKARQAKLPRQVNLLTDHADPESVAIKVGESVQFNTKDGLRHNIGQGKGLTPEQATEQAAHDDEGAADHDATPHTHIHDHQIGGMKSGEFGLGEAWKATFKQKGTYEFHDHLHPTIRILVVVY